MAKTCRTCEFCYPRYGCSEEQMPLDHIITDYGCTEHKPRETPLLVDRLAKMVRLLMSPVGEAISERAEAVDAAKVLLEEYQEEVGDVKS